MTMTRVFRNEESRHKLCKEFIVNKGELSKFNRAEKIRLFLMAMHMDNKGLLVDRDGSPAYESTIAKFINESQFNIEGILDDMISKKLLIRTGNLYYIPSRFIVDNADRLSAITFQSSLG